MTPEAINNQCIKLLEKADLDSRVAVVGSGPSKAFIPDVAAIEDALCQRCGIQKPDDSEPFWMVCERAFQKNDTEYYKVLKENFEHEPFWTSDTYRHVLKIRFKGFATLNYDTQLPKVFWEKYQDQYDDLFSYYPPRKKKQIYAGAMELFGDPQRLIALHGFVDHNYPKWEKYLILKYSDYCKHYENSAPLFQWWRELLLGGPCIFIGASLEEPGLELVIKQLLLRGHEDRLKKIRHIHLVPSNNGNSQRPDFTLKVIERVHFHPVDKKKFNGLLDVLSYFSGIPTKLPSPSSREPLKITLTGVGTF